MIRTTNVKTLLSRGPVIRSKHFLLPTNPLNIRKLNILKRIPDFCLIYALNDMESKKIVK